MNWFRDLFGWALHDRSVDGDGRTRTCAPADSGLTSFLTSSNSSAAIPLSHSTALAAVSLAAAGDRRLGGDSGGGDSGGGDSGGGDGGGGDGGGGSD
jgi:hypothetical protein